MAKIISLTPTLAKAYLSNMCILKLEIKPLAYWRTEGQIWDRLLLTVSSSYHSPQQESQLSLIIIINNKYVLCLVFFKIYQCVRCINSKNKFKYIIKFPQLKNVLKKGIYCLSYLLSFCSMLYFFWVLSCVGFMLPNVFFLNEDFLIYLLPPPFTIWTTFGVSVP